MKLGVLFLALILLQPFIVVAPPRSTIEATLAPAIDVSHASPNSFQYFNVANEPSPVLGTYTVAVVAVYFKDLEPTRTIEDLDTLMKRVGEYYEEASFGKFSLSWTIFGWVRLDKPLAYYGKDGAAIDDVNFDGEIDSYRLVMDAVAVFEKETPIPQHDYLIVCHAGYGQESSGNSTDVWSVAYVQGIWIKTKEKGYSKFAIVSELEAKGAEPLGVWAHEFGHLLGLSDLYAKDEKANPSVGFWDLMARGSWGGNPPGSSPSHFCAWNKIQLGWIEQSQILTVDSGIRIESALSFIEVASGSIKAIKVPIDDEKYYLIEARGGIGFDSFLSSGILLLFVDEKKHSRMVTVVPQHGDSSLSTATLSVGELFFAQTGIVQVAPTACNSNSFSVIIDRESLKADIVVRVISLIGKRIEAGSTAPLQIEVKNQGAVAAALKLNVYSDAVLTYSKDLSLMPNQLQTLSISISAPVGVHKIKALAEGLSDVNGYNNRAELSLEAGYLLTIRTQKNAWVKVNGTEYVSKEGIVEAFITSSSPIAIEAQTIVQVSESVRKRFVGWSSGIKLPAYEFRMNSSMSLSANYITQFYVEVMNADGSGWYDEGSTLLLMVDNPRIIELNKTRDVFLGWFGSVSANSPSLRITVKEPMNIMAKWKRQHFLMIKSQFPVEGAGWYDENAIASVSVEDFKNATIKAVFKGWSGYLESRERKISIKIDGPKLLKASWHVAYLIRLVFLNELGRPISTPISAIALEAKNGSLLAMNFPSSQLWLEEGEWTVKSIVFKGVDCKAEETVLTPYANASLKVLLRVFLLIVNVRSQLTDFPISEGEVVVEFIEREGAQLNKSGIAVFNELPRGNYTIKVFNEEKHLFLGKDEVLILRVIPLIEFFIFLLVPIILVLICVFFALFLARMKKFQNRFFIRSF